MSMFMTILLIIVVGIIGFSLAYTLFARKERRTAGGELDSEIPGEVQQHTNLRNPIFLTYAIFFLLALIFIAYMAVTSNW